MRQARQQGFTLIELSIVLVIIGLLIGAVLVGKDMIANAAISAQIAQITKYNTAVYTFYGKYGYLPGDIPDPQATALGFQPRGQYVGEGDGNGLLYGIYANTIIGGWWAGEGGGETAMFWVDLSTANMIDGTFNTATSTTPAPSTTGTALNAYLPQAKIGGGNYVYVYSGHSGQGVGLQSGTNYFGISAVQDIAATCGGGCMTSSPGMTSIQASYIDQKIDDGNPALGRVVISYVTGSTLGFSPDTFAGAPAATTTCWTWPSPTVWSNAIYNTTSTGKVCALSFQFQ